MDIAYGSDYALGDPDLVQLARLRVGRPERVQYIGTEDLPGERLLAACDFQGNDFSTLYCLDTANFGRDDRTDLYTVDTETAELTHLASFPLTGVDFNEGLDGLTYDPTTGRMFAIACDPIFGVTDTLYELDLEALTLTQIGESVEGPCLDGLGADNDGQLWGLDDSEDGLSSIDKHTGEITFVGPFGFEVAFGQGMDFDASNNTCYLFVFNVDTYRGELHRCDTETGQTQFVGALGVENHGEGQWGTGAIAAVGPCHVTLELGADEVQAGDPLTVHVGIVHNRAETVSAPLSLTIEDASGNVVASRTGMRSMKLAQHLDQQLLLRVPKTLPPGSYVVALEVGEMEQGTVRVTAPLTVVAASSE
jgi:hypothetical protein